jgi:hypothetical protein
MMAVGDHETVELGLLALQCGLTLPSPDISHKGASSLQDYGTLAPDKSNVILYPTSYGAHHTDIEWLIGRQRVLDPKRYFIVIPNQFGNGLSTVAKQSDPTVWSRPQSFVHPLGQCACPGTSAARQIRRHPPGPRVRVVHGGPRSPRVVPLTRLERLQPRAPLSTGPTGTAARRSHGPSPPPRTGELRATMSGIGRQDVYGANNAPYRVDN